MPRKFPPTFSSIGFCPEATLCVMVPLSADVGEGDINEYLEVRVGGAEVTVAVVVVVIVVFGSKCNFNLVKARPSHEAVVCDNNFVSIVWI
jgi:hypothetical protein